MILKSNAKFLILLCEDGDDRYVLKHDLRNAPHLQAEFGRIQTLRNSNSFFSEHLTEVMDCKVRQVAGMGEALSYRMPFYEGSTLSKILANSEIPLSTKKNLVETLFDKILAHIRNASVNRINPQEKSWGDIFADTMSNIGKIDYLSRITGNSTLSINGTPIRIPIEKFINEMRASQEVCQCDGIIHANFHGDNIIVPDVCTPETFRIIDPDCSIPFADPMFSLARFFYTPIHDAVEHGNYSVKFDATSDEEASLTTRDLWAEDGKNGYDLLSMEHGYFADVLKPRMDDVEFHRLRMNYIWCLLRGINANENGFEMYESGGQFLVKSNAVYLMTKAINCVNYC